MKRRVLVLMSIYNGHTYLRQQIDSLATQENVELALLARDDGSPNNSSCAILNEYKAKKSFPLMIIKGRNLGFALSFSELIREAADRYVEDFDYFAFCDQDDVWLPQKLEMACAALDTEQAIQSQVPMLYCSQTTLTDADLIPIRNKKKKNVKLSKECSLLQNFATGCTMVVNRTAIELYASHVRGSLYAHDLMMYQMCMFLGKVIWDSNSYILYRQHGHNQIGSGAGFVKRMRQRMSFKNNSDHYELQSKRLLSAFKEKLTVEDIGIISKFCFYKNSMWSRFALLFDKKFRYNNWESNFFYMIKILWGGIIPLFMFPQLAARN